VPEIQASKAYADGGLIVITTDAAPGTGPGADRSSCCTPPTFPNVPGQPAGGGRVGMLLLSDLLAAPGTQVPSASDHYDLLATLEDTFGLPRLGYAARKTVKGIGLPALLKSTEGSDGSDVATTG
jgi:phosphatidylinositol-3-phosphatase